jgi:hypothetical protein
MSDADSESEGGDGGDNDVERAAKPTDPVAAS